MNSRNLITRINGMQVLVRQVHRHGVSRADLALALEMLGYLIGSRDVRSGEVFEVGITGPDTHPCDLVEIGPEDDVFLAKRGFRKTLTPMVRGRVRPLTNELFVVFRYAESLQGAQLLVLTSFYGQQTFKEIAQYDTPDSFLEAYRFWSRHAIIPEEGTSLTVSDEFGSFADYARHLSIQKFGSDVIG